jgi:hypothetical protein
MLFLINTDLASYVYNEQTNKIEKIRIPKESPKRQNRKCCRPRLIESVHRRNCQV